MQHDLAERLLAKVLGWDEDEISQEIPKLLAIARSKYDQYQQYRPGMRFIESLAAWLGQFKTAEEKREAYNLVLHELVYISSEEMFHLIQMAFPDHIRPRMMQSVANELGLPEHAVARIANSPAFLALQTRTLYLGLSDGSQVGLLRRLNPGVIGHEHTLITYEPPDANKSKKMREKHLSEALENALGKNHGQDLTFRHLVLVDDFTASGISFIRKEVEDGKEVWNGKLAKVLAWIKKDHYLDLLAETDMHLTLLFYVATQDAIDRIRHQAIQYCEEEQLSITLDVRAVQVLSEQVKVKAPAETLLGSILRQYVDVEELVNEHWEKGVHIEPYLGYNECALPLVVFHNTPNNSLPILWFASRDKGGPDSEGLLPLFPRTTRHGTI